jgi:hypothetical protein
MEPGLSFHADLASGNIPFEASSTEGLVAVWRFDSPVSILVSDRLSNFVWLGTKQGGLARLVLKASYQLSSHTYNSSGAQVDESVMGQSKVQADSICQQAGEGGRSKDSGTVRFSTSPTNEARSLPVFNRTSRSPSTPGQLPSMTVDLDELSASAMIESPLIDTWSLQPDTSLNLEPQTDDGSEIIKISDGIVSGIVPLSPDGDLLVTTSELEAIWIDSDFQVSRKSGMTSSMTLLTMCQPKWLSDGTLPLKRSSKQVLGREVVVLGVDSEERTPQRPQAADSPSFVEFINAMALLQLSENEVGSGQTSGQSSDGKELAELEAVKKLETATNNKLLLILQNLENCRQN